MICPLCESECPDDASACEQCGKLLVIELHEEQAPEPMPEFASTQLGADDLDIAFAMAALDDGSQPIAALEDFEPTAPEQDATAASSWSDDELQLEQDRADDPYLLKPERVPEVVAVEGGESMLCPVCYSRVPVAERCVECRVPLTRLAI